MTPSDIALNVEALLFAEGDSLTYKKLASYLGCDEAMLQQGLSQLELTLRGTGLALIRTDVSVALSVSPEARGTVAEVLKREQEREIGDAGLEVLGILLYEGPSTRSDIDYIRGVNSSSTIRTLLLRGLIERQGNPEDGREFVYRPTTELLAHLGVTEVKNLPDHAQIVHELEEFKKSAQQDFPGTDTAHAQS